MTRTPPPGIFKAYDVRGIAGEEIDGDVAEAVGRAFVRVLAGLAGKPKDELRLGLGRDMRIGADELSQRYREGMVSEGATVLDAGMIATEMLYFLVGSRDLDGGLMCTASHNPPEYTGAKLVERGAIALSGDRGIQDVRRAIEAGLGEPPGGGSFEEIDIYDDFRADALKFIDPEEVKPLRVVVDGSNGMAGRMVGPILEGFGLDLVELFWTPDGHFPGHGPNPLLEENRRFIVETLLEKTAELGIAWDGDADRCFFKTRMRDEGGVFGGEVSGHYYFHDFYNADSGTIPALLILELLSLEGKRMSELLEPYRSKYFISGEINTEVADQQAKMEEIEEHYSDGQISHLDGVSVDYDDWHFNVRPSNTEPLLRLNLESLVSPEDMERRRDEVLDLIRS
jgi:phosphomannomutase